MVKRTLGGSGGPFTFFVDGPGNNSAKQKGRRSRQVPRTGRQLSVRQRQYTITETGLPDGGGAGTWVLTDATCLGVSEIETFVSLSNNQVSVVVNGNTPLATCTFTNTFQAFTPTPTSTVTPTPTDAADSPPDTDRCRRTPPTETPTRRARRRTRRAADGYADAHGTPTNTPVPPTDTPTPADRHAEQHADRTPTPTNTPTNTPVPPTNTPTPHADQHAGAADQHADSPRRPTRRCRRRTRRLPPPRRPTRRCRRPTRRSPRRPTRRCRRPTRRLPPPVAKEAARLSLLVRAPTVRLARIRDAGRAAGRQRRST